MSETVFKWAIIENVAIYTAIAVISLGGVILTGQWYGLWSLLLMLVLNSFETTKPPTHTEKH